MPTTLVVDDTRLEQIYEEIRGLLRELDPALSDDDVEAALTRLLFYAQREKKAGRVSDQRRPEPGSE